MNKLLILAALIFLLLWSLDVRPAKITIDATCIEKQLYLTVATNGSLMTIARLFELDKDEPMKCDKWKK